VLGYRIFELNNLTEAQINELISWCFEMHNNKQDAAWDYNLYWFPSKQVYSVKFKFADKDVAMLFKLIWG
jgi:hypothetical protein